MIAADATQDIWPIPNKRANSYFENVVHGSVQTRAETCEQLHPPSDGYGLLTPDISIADHDFTNLTNSLDYGSNVGINYEWADNSETDLFMLNEPTDGAVEEVCFGMVRARKAHIRTYLLKG